MALAQDSSCLLASAFPRDGNAGAPEPAAWLDGSGSYLPFAVGAGFFTFAQTGLFVTGNPNNWLEVAPGDANNVGRECYWKNQGDVDTRGVVIAAFQTEQGTSGGTGALAQFVMVQASDYRYLAAVSAVTFTDD